MIKPHYLFERLYELKRIELRMNEQQKYDVIKSLVDHNGNKKAAALKLGCTIRTINRLISKYKKQGKSAFIHGNRGRKPAHAISDALIDDIITLYNHKYYDATFSHACELLAENDDIFISPSALTNIMYKNFIVSPRTTRTVRKRLETQLHELHAKSSSKRKQDALFSLQASQICVFWRNDTNGCLCTFMVRLYKNTFTLSD